MTGISVFGGGMFVLAWLTAMEQLRTGGTPSPWTLAFMISGIVVLFANMIALNYMGRI